MMCRMSKAETKEGVKVNLMISVHRDFTFQNLQVFLHLQDAVLLRYYLFFMLNGNAIIQHVHKFSDAQTYGLSRDRKCVCKKSFNQVPHFRSSIHANCSERI